MRKFIYVKNALRACDKHFYANTLYYTMERYINIYFSTFLAKGKENRVWSSIPVVKFTKTCTVI